MDKVSWYQVLIIGVDEGIDMLPKLFDGVERGAAKGFAFEDRKPDLDLVELGRARLTCCVKVWI
jgi:hypothetical protein